MKIPGKTVLLWALGIFSMRLSAQELVVYPPPQAIIYSAHNDDYTVKVRKPGGAWQDLFEYNVRVDMDKVQDASMVYFDFSGTVEIFIRKNNGNLQSVRIRPSAHGIIPVVKGNTISFTLARPLNLSIEFNGDKLHNLHLFASPIEKKRPDPADTNVVYFGPGVHTPPDTVKKSFYIASGKTVYIAGGAIVRGKLVCRNVNNVHIIGRGIIDQPVEGVEISGCSNVEVDGIIVVDPQHYTVAGGGSQHIVIRNLKSFSCKGWGDGLDFMSCSDVLIDNVFMRNSDDCIAIYGHRWNFYGNATNYTITNSVLWADIAHPVNIGTHGDTRIAGDTIEHILFKNIDILEQDEDDPEYEGCMAISDGDSNLIRNIRFENIRVDDFEEGQLLNIRVVFNHKYNTGAGRGVENIYFKNISYNGINNSPAVIDGFDKDHLVRGIVFENLRINGRLVMSPAAANIRVGAFAQQVRFKN